MRLDVYLADKGFFGSRTKSAEAVSRGEVSVNGKVVTKASFDVSDGDDVSISDSACKYVSVGAYKLEKAFKDSPSFSIKNAVVCDIGASAGGFTEVCLLHGAKKVFAVDVGENLLDESLKKRKEVVVIDKTNARFLNGETLGEKVDRVVSDVSFISLTLILPSVFSILKDGGEAVLLIKPQFECGKKALNKNGIVTEKKAREAAIETVTACARENGLIPSGITSAPEIPGKNIEYLLYLKKACVFALNDRV